MRIGEPRRLLRDRFSEPRPTDALRSARDIAWLLSSCSRAASSCRLRIEVTAGAGERGVGGGEEKSA